MKRTSALIFSLFWTLVILTLCLMPSGGVPEVNFEHFDKLVHFSMFFILGVLLMYATSTKRSTVIALMLGIGYAILTEFLQGIVPWERNPSSYDVIANLLGLLTGAFVCSKFQRVQSKISV